MKHIQHVKRNQRNWTEKNYIFLLLKFRDQNL